MPRRSTTPPAPAVGGPAHEVGRRLGRLDARRRGRGRPAGPRSPGRARRWSGRRPRHPACGTPRVEQAPEGGHEVGDGEHLLSVLAVCAREHKCSSWDSCCSAQGGIPGCAVTLDAMAPITAAGLPVPQRVAVVGAGMVGLSTAWFLQEHGVEVTVLDREGVAAGSSWGNAGLADARHRDAAAGAGRPQVRPARRAVAVLAGLRAAERRPQVPQVRHRVHQELDDEGSGRRRWARSCRSTTCRSRASTCCVTVASQAETREAKSFLASYRTEAERRDPARGDRAHPRRRPGHRVRRPHR